MSISQGPLTNSTGWAVSHMTGHEPPFSCVHRPSTSAGAMKLSILMPAFNEQRTIADAVVSVLRQHYPCAIELIIVNDGSVDATADILGALRHPDARVVTHARNLGKGAALQTAASVATGTHLVPFDADLEYSPADLVPMIKPVMEGRTDVVYGVRLFGANTRYLSLRQALGNRVLTFVANLMFDAWLTDMHTCLKLVPVEVFREFNLCEAGFGLDTEITARLLAAGMRPFEVPVSYHSRSVEHGKKITWRDGVECLHVLTKVRVSRPAAPMRRRDPLDALSASIESPLAASIEKVSELSQSHLAVAADAGELRLHPAAA
jgi:glycosyltransferase involved in cell wall biosynthesis